MKQLLNGADRFVTYWFTGVQQGSKAVQHDLDIWLDRDVQYRWGGWGQGSKCMHVLPRDATGTCALHQ